VGATLAHRLLPALAADLLDLDASPPWRTAAAAATSSSPHAVDDPQAYVGTYGRLHQRIVVTETAGGLTLITEPSGVLARLGARGEMMSLRPVDPARGVFALTDPATAVEQVVVFDNGDHLTRSVHLDGRLHRRWT